jgi:hypothetical protein
MKNSRDTSWSALMPPLGEKDLGVYLTYAHRLGRVGSQKTDDATKKDLVDEIRHEFIDSLQKHIPADRQILVAASLVLTDLVIQGWALRVQRGVAQVKPPEMVQQAEEKQRIQRQELVRRNAQLRQPAVKEFIRSMERSRYFNGRFVSIFSLMRDGRELAKALRQTRKHLDNGRTETLSRVIDPYLQFVSENTRCTLTGLRLMDIWRYFRHTWTNQYTSVPGRTIMFIVRDRAALHHPVIGIGALSSPVVQIRERDIWVGWHPETFFTEIKNNPTCDIANWLVGIVKRMVDEIYVDDFREEGLITSRQTREPDQEVIKRLLQESAEQRRAHYRYARSRDHKQNRGDRTDTDHWIARSRTHLFRSKRALALADLLQARAVLNQYLGEHPTAECFARLAATSIGSSVIRKVLKKAKANKVGIAVADISVCGAVQPYNAILGGKLVSMLAVSPEVVAEYKKRYSEATSEIASAIAGRPVVKPPNLVLLGTTSLYGLTSSQYNRVKIPCELLGGKQGETIEFLRLGHSESFGTTQYSDETVGALVTIVQQSANGQRINSIFGEGVSPKLRKVREGLDLLNFSSDLLLRHYRRRGVYAVNLVRNLRAYLLNMVAEPDYLVPPECGTEKSANIAAWWRERWLRNRISSDAVLEEIARHTLVRPIRHGARVPYEFEDLETTEAVLI